LFTDIEERFLAHYRRYGSRKAHKKPSFGAHGDEEIPVLIPNTEVKLISGDYTATSGKLARCRIIEIAIRIGWLFSFLNYASPEHSQQNCPKLQSSPSSHVGNVTIRIMKRGRSLVAGLVALSVLVGGIGASAVARADSEKITFRAADYSSMRHVVAKVRLPTISQPTWLKKQLAAEAASKAAAAKKAASTVTVTYDVTTRGAITSNVAEFRQHANATLNDGRGWARMNVVFKEVASGGQFTLVLAEASQLPTFSSGCSSEYSCRAGRYVVINQTRWQSATSSWNKGGGSLRDYRHMVVNHEVGHWLGHDHESCRSAGSPAAVMQQQSIDLQGCSFNPWPLASELWSTQLGIV
jgi:hypothetical protein